jgi:hypothetical protein
MALEMIFWVVDDATIQKLNEASLSVASFLEDHEPAGSGPNHRNVDIFHFILNGTEEPVSGIKGIFENLDDECAIAVGEEVTAITSESTRQLLKTFRKLDETTIGKRWSRWIKLKGLVEDENEPGLNEAERMRRRERRAEEEADRYFHDALEIWLSPVMIARYCLPPTSKVIGGALIPLPRLNVHSSCMLSSS